MGELVAQIVWGWRVFPTSRKQYKTLDKVIKLRHNIVIGLKSVLSLPIPRNFRGIQMTNAKTQNDSISIIKSIVVAVHAGHTALEVINAKVKECKTLGLTFGKSVKTCVNRATLQDAMKGTFKGVSSKTVANYITSIVGAVNDDVPFSFSASKGKAKGGASGDSTPATIDSIIAKVFSHKDFNATIKKIEETYNSKTEERTLAQCVQFYLESEGYKISE